MGHFCPPGSGLRIRIQIRTKGLIESGSNPDPDPNPAYCLQISSNKSTFLHHQAKSNHAQVIRAVFLKTITVPYSMYTGIEQQKTNNTCDPD
jgi:hypothetical protein